jgi:hypothetical protein
MGNTISLYEPRPTADEISNENNNQLRQIIVSITNELQNKETEIAALAARLKAGGL